MLKKRKKEQMSGSERVRAARRRSQSGRYIADINIRGVALLTTVFVILLATVVLCVKKVIKPVNVSGEISTQSTVDIANEKLKKHISIDEVDITGMKMAEAKSAIERVYPWKMKLHIDDNDSLELNNILDQKLDKLLSEIYSDIDKANTHYDISFDDVDIEEMVNEAKKKWDIPPQNGSISGFNKDTKSFTYTHESDGFLIDENRLKGDLKSFTDRKDFQADILVVRNEAKPSVTEVSAKEKYKVIGTFTTKTTDNKDRNTNISLASEALDGLIIKPGEEFSFNNTTGNRTEERGYRPAGAYVNGVLSEEPGGGVCQVSSTLYNAVIFAGLTTTERHAHSYEPTYVTPGEDAMVSYDGYAGPDMKFVNTCDTAIAIRAVLTGQTLTCSIIGIPILEDGVSIEMESKKIADLDPPAPEYIEDKSLKKGKEVVISEAKKGSRWATTYIVKKNGSIIKEEPFHNSTYRGKPAKIKVNSQSETTSTPKSSIETSIEGTKGVKSDESLSKKNAATTAESTVEKIPTDEVSKTEESVKQKESVEETVEKLTTEADTVNETVPEPEN
ncbi:MAG: VanW family protein [Lachnospiraceae bacterium]|nr:VanW family protein [Lachnospiraceae bacterium]